MEKNIVAPRPSSLPQLEELGAASPLGKQLSGALYVHRSALIHLSPELREYEQRARRCLRPEDEFTLVKFQTPAPKIAYLLYPDFEDDPHPALAQSIQVNLETGQVRYSDYRNRANPPILHRNVSTIITVPVHGNRDLPIGTLKGILKDVELTEDDL